MRVGRRRVCVQALISSHAMRSSVDWPGVRQSRDRRSRPAITGLEIKEWRRPQAMTATLNPIDVVQGLGPTFAARAADLDASDSFVQQNYADLKARKSFSAGVPEELGGGGANHAELAQMLRELARYCSSTALALSMHTHQVAIPAWRWRNEAGAPGEAFLRRIAAEELILVSSGGSDWLDSSGSLERVDGGYRMAGRKVFFQWLAQRRPADDLRHLRRSFRRAGGPALPAVDEGPGRASLGQLAHPGHARHRLERRGYRWRFHPRGSYRSPEAEGQMGNVISPRGDASASTHLLGLRRRG